MSMMSAATVSCEKTDGAEAGEFMLFGVRVIVDPIRKSVSLNNLSQYGHRHDFLNNINSEKDVAAGYASADEAVHHQSSSTAAAGNSITATPNINSRERKRGVPWTEEEHKLFLIGLQKVGKGDWRCISRNFVKTRTPTQVASHAQKYFLRRSNLNRRRRRSSLFDITTDTVATTSAEDRQMSPAPSLQPIKSSRVELPAEALVAQDSTAGLPRPFIYPAAISSTTVLSASPSNPNIRGILSEESYRQNDDQNNNLMRPLTGNSISESDMNENWLSLSLPSDNIKPAFAVDTRFSNEDGIISVA